MSKINTPFKKRVNKILCSLWNHKYHITYDYGDCGRKTWTCSSCTNKSYTEPSSGVVEYRVTKSKGFNNVHHH